MNADVLMRAGAILLPNAKVSDDVLTDDVVARQWNHPGLVDPIVRLPTENMLRGVDLEMDLLGFDEPEGKGAVGKQRRRKLGFPGWALVNDPDHARYALDVVNDLKKATRRVKSKPGAAKDMVTAIADRLAKSVPNFLPSFYEEAARGFLAFENYSYASQFFEKAREAERVYALEVDPELREQTFVDFALARALSIKSLTNFGKEMIDKDKAEEGYHSYFRIAVRRTRGGLPPSPAMAKDLKRLAKAAKLDPVEEEKRFLKELFGAAALKMAAAGFWKAYKKSLVALAKEDPEARSSMLDLFPNMHPRDWFEILDMCDACKSLYDDSVEPESKSKHHTADWFGFLLKQQNRGWRGSNDIPGRTFELIELCGDRLKTDGVPVPLPDGWGGINPDVLEAFMDHDVDFVIPEYPRFVGLDDLVDKKDEPYRCRDWAHMAKHEKLREIALETIDNGDYYLSSWVELVPDRPALKELVGEWLTKAVAKASESGALISSYETLTRFDGYPQLLWALFPEQTATLMATDIAIPLQNTLKIGVLDEFGWDAWDEIRTAFPNRDELKASWNFPYLVVWDKVRMKVIGPEGVKLECDLPSHKDHELNDAIYSKDSVLFIFKKNWTDYGQWLGESKLWELEDSVNYRDTCMLLPDGRTMFNGYRIFTPGDRKFPYDYEKATGCISDGKTFWKTPDYYSKNKKFTEYDPITGKKSGESQPPFLSDGDTVYSGTLFHAPGAKDSSPIGVKNELYGKRWTRADEEGNWDYTLETMSGMKQVGSYNPDYLLSVPGSDEPRQFVTTWRDFEFRDKEGVVAANSQRSFRRGGFPNIDPRFMAYFEVRDEKGSKALRNVSLEVCTKLIEATDGEAENDDAIIDAIKKHLPDVTHDELRKGIAGVVRLAFEQRDMLDKLNKKLEETPTESLLGYPKDPKTISSATYGYMSCASGDNVVLAQIADAAEFFQREDANDGDGGVKPAGSAEWETSIGFSGAYAYRAILPFTEDENREVLKQLLEAFAHSPFVGDDLDKRIQFFELEKKYSDPDEEDEIVPAFRKGIEDGVTMVTADGNDYFTWSQWSAYKGIEFARSGKLKVTGTETIPIGPGWGTPEQIGELFELYEKNGPIPVQDAIESFAEQTGLTIPEATLAVSDWGRDLGGKLKSTVLKWATDIFSSRPVSARTFFTNVIAGGPVEDLWDAQKLANRLASTWLEHTPKMAPLDEAFMTSWKKDNKYSSSAVIREIADPKMPSDLNKDREWHWYNGYESTTDGFYDAESYVSVLDYAMQYAPVDSSIYKGIASGWERIRERISNPDYLINICYMWDEESPIIKKALELKGKPKNVHSDNEEEVRGKDGLFLNKGSYRFQIYANYKAIVERGELIELVEAHNEMDSAAKQAVFIMDDLVDSIIDRAKNTPVPDGGYEANPIVSVPDIVKEVGAKYDISENAAGLYLQLLALPFPSDAYVRKWNGWTKKPHDTAIKELVDKKLVVQAKRSRASRSVFIHGPWEPKTWDKPIEGWKFTHLEWLDAEGEWNWQRAFSDCTLFPPHVLFERAWKRVKDGDEPGFQEPPK